MSGLSGQSRGVLSHDNIVIGPSITYTPYHPMSFARGGHIGLLPVSAGLFPQDKQVNNVMANNMRKSQYNEAFRRQVINPFN